MNLPSGLLRHSRHTSFLALALLLSSGASVAQSQSAPSADQPQPLATPQAITDNDSSQLSPQARRTSSHQSILVNGTQRTFLLYVPRSYQPGRSALLIALHGRGAGGPAAAMEAYTHLDDKADQAGFAIAYLDGLPDATGTVNWNYFYDPFFVNGPDDVSFVRDVIDSLGQTLRSDRRKIYVTGTSAGGFMAQRVAVELSDRVAAVGVVQGGLFVYAPNSPASIPHAVAPVSILFLKGDQDPNNQYCGATFPTFGVHESSADDDFDYWSGPAANQCALILPNAPLCKSNGIADANGTVTPGQPTAVVRKEALVCRGNTEVKHYRLLGGVDQWNLRPLNNPGSVPYNPDLNILTGVTTNEILWRFFEEHPKGGFRF